MYNTRRLCESSTTEFKRHSLSLYYKKVVVASMTVAEDDVTRSIHTVWHPVIASKSAKYTHYISHTLQPKELKHLLTPSTQTTHEQPTLARPISLTSHLTRLIQHHHHHRSRRNKHATNRSTAQLHSCASPPPRCTRILISAAPALSRTSHSTTRRQHRDDARHYLHKNGEGSAQSTHTHHASPPLCERLGRPQYSAWHSVVCTYGREPMCSDGKA